MDADDEFYQTDPPVSMISSRHVLGAFLLRAARQKAASLVQQVGLKGLPAFITAVASTPALPTNNKTDIQIGLMGSTRTRSLLSARVVSEHAAVVESLLDEAEEVYRSDLAARGPTDSAAAAELAAVEKELKEASQYADMEIRSSWL